MNKWMIWGGNTPIFGWHPDLYSDIKIYSISNSLASISKLWFMWPSVTTDKDDGNGSYSDEHGTVTAGACF